MKGMKKLLSILMVLTLVMSLGATAFAATVTIATKTGLDADHDYVAYQIFKGTQAEGKNAPIGDIEWGDDIDSAKFLKTLKTLDAAKYGACEDAKDVAKALGPDASADVVKAFGEAALNSLKNEATGTKMTAGSAELPNGYYVIKDVTDPSKIGEGEVYNDIVVEVTGGDIVIEAKNEGPSSQKKVKDVNDSTGVTSDWQDSADYDIGDQVPYELTVTIPSVSAYDTYYVHMIDVISEGLTYDNNATITLNNEDVTSAFTPGVTNYADYTGEKPTGYDGGKVLTWNIDDIIALAKEKGVEAPFTIKVNYTATLNENAKIGSAGNPNTFRFDYKRNPNAEGDGHTPWDTNLVFTFDFATKKVDGKGEDLEGAEFKLLKKLATEPADAATASTGDVEKLGDTGIKYYNDGTNYWTIVELTVSGDKKNIFSSEGLDDGDYMLVETKTPAGYNSIEPLEFTITAEHETESESPKLTNLTGGGKDVAYFTFEESGDPNVSGKVVNEEGVTLPETGGIGTTIFYIAGAVLVAGAVILLVTKKRVSGMEK